ncbi:hypothetical protein GCM10028801_12140 [Nocardioides maradonensis]
MTRQAARLAIRGRRMRCEKEGDIADPREAKVVVAPRVQPGSSAPQARTTWLATADPRKPMPNIRRPVRRAVNATARTFTRVLDRLAEKRVGDSEKAADPTDPRPSR